MNIVDNITTKPVQIGNVKTKKAAAQGCATAESASVGSVVYRGEVDVSGSVTPPTNVYVNTTAWWDSHRDLIGKKNAVYVYTDHETSPDGEPVPGFKVGDGLGYLIDAPFNDDIMMDHIRNHSIHVTEDEKVFWGNKVTAYIDARNPERLILSKE